MKIIKYSSAVKNITFSKYDRISKWSISIEKKFMTALRRVDFVEKGIWYEWRISNHFNVRFKIGHTLCMFGKLFIHLFTHNVD